MISIHFLEGESTTLVPQPADTIDFDEASYNEKIVYLESNTNDWPMIESYWLLTASNRLTHFFKQTSSNATFEYMQRFLPLADQRGHVLV